MGEESSMEKTKAGNGNTSIVAAAWVVFSFSVSLIGAFILVYWSRCYHEGNEELWMVPVGIVLFGVPIFIWFSLVASEAGRRWQPENSSSTVSPAPEPDENLIVDLYL
ncbi:hypothetical protein H6P81_016512 [Aristolochia fimbriata]|uniref:Transmembrane protein n=1 Tax=Aristolochia fimbriata TaxID=158543 RepID=A0AAV7EBQ5_ARIFI|nr:hypothetical protein H6P81_016512 [Aristolochia fimbriata]